MKKGSESMKNCSFIPRLTFFYQHDWPLKKEMGRPLAGLAQWIGLQLVDGLKFDFCQGHLSRL